MKRNRYRKHPVVDSGVRECDKCKAIYRRSDLRRTIWGIFCQYCKFEAKPPLRRENLLELLVHQGGDRYPMFEILVAIMSEEQQQLACQRWYEYEMAGHFQRLEEASRILPVS